MGYVGRIVHECHRSFLRGPLDDDAQCGIFTFKAFMAGSAGEIFASVLGDERSGRSDIVRDPVLIGGGDG